MEYTKAADVVSGRLERSGPMRPPSPSSRWQPKHGSRSRMSARAFAAANGDSGRGRKLVDDCAPATPEHETPQATSNTTPARCVRVAGIRATI